MNTHTHFCHLCHGRFPGGVRASDGWWRCSRQPCVKLQSTLCPKHQQRIDENRKRAEVSR
jgi:hypothetical protein